MLTKVAQNDCWLLGYFEKSINVKTDEDIFRQLVEKFGQLFYLNIWSHCLSHTPSLFNTQFPSLNLLFLSNLLPLSLSLYSVKQTHTPNLSHLNFNLASLHWRNNVYSFFLSHSMPSFSLTLCLLYLSLYVFFYSHSMSSFTLTLCLLSLTLFLSVSLYLLFLSLYVFIISNSIFFSFTLSSFSLSLCLHYL